MTPTESVEKAVHQTIEGYSKALVILTAALTSLANTAAIAAETIIRETERFQKELDQAYKDKILTESVTAMLPTKEKENVS